MALLMLHNLKTVFIGKLASRTLVAKVYHVAMVMYIPMQAPSAQIQVPFSV